MWYKQMIETSNLDKWLKVNELVEYGRLLT